VKVTALCICFPQAALGQGVDRHLLGLKLAAIENGMQVHPLYKDPSYVRSTHFKITSSQVTFLLIYIYNSHLRCNFYFP
jgi:carnitine O-acetyltransferase